MLAVAVVWGVTNPFLKRGGSGIEDIERTSWLRQLIAEFSYLLLNWKYLLPFLFNQSGSVLYYVTLSSTDISLAAPVVNSLTFVITGLTGKLLGEEFGGTGSMVGAGLVVFGVFLCAWSKISS